jgi:nicotinamidase-related amidase
MPMPDKLLIIDPQNDFCDIEGAALPVPGAEGDLNRLAAFVEKAGGDLGEIIVTLDSHPTVAIERVTFWQHGTGAPVAPFTAVTARAVRSGDYVPRNPALLPDVLAYLDALEGAGRYTLMVWPVHCVVGTWGHAIPARLGRAIAAWEELKQRNALKILKGQHPLAEQYSAVRAEVPRADDARTQTNRDLLEAATPTGGLLFVAGEALSHCVAATLRDLFAAISPGERERVVLLQDCMSPVAGFGHEFLAEAEKTGARGMTSALAARHLNERSGSR